MEQKPNLPKGFYGGALLFGVLVFVFLVIWGLVDLLGDLLGG